MLNNDFDFNFWPSFTDLMLSLVLVVLIILGAVSKGNATGDEDIKKAKLHQDKICEEIKNELASNRYIVEYARDTNAEDTTNKRIKSSADIFIINKLDRQTITFSDRVLFDVGQSVLKKDAYDVLNCIGPIIKGNLKNIGEIQIQGHADTSPSLYKDNLVLASERAITVYNYLKNNVGIDPSQYLMSATTFGEYKPVGREAGIGEFNKTKLYEANSTTVLKAKNRRIEIVLFYKNEVLPNSTNSK